MAQVNVKEISKRLSARNNCKAAGNIEWFEKHTDAIKEQLKHLPNGSGIDNGVKFDYDNSTPEKLIFTFGFHHMNDGGFYDGWTDHKLTVTASLQHGILLKISGTDRNGVKEYLYDLFHDLIVAV